MLFRIADWVRGQLGRDLGRRGEDLAHRYLRKRKYTIVARNYRPSSGAPGEIDIVAREGEKLVFVEVKTRASNAISFPERAVDYEKRRHIIRTARDYAKRADVAWENVRFDVVAITGDEKPVIEHLRDAFEE
ncbi:MAG TPA: YraN family protein [Bryobacteraceae bacterium]|jgi:putative endonuclease